MVKSAAGSATYLAGLTDELLQYYLQFAKGGVELIWVEMVPEWEPPTDGSPLPQEAIEFGKKLVKECGKYGAKLGYQTYGLTEAGRRIDEQEIVAIQDRYVEIAKHIHQMGFAGFEINAAGFTSASNFLSRFQIVALMNTAKEVWKIGRAL